MRKMRKADSVNLWLSVIEALAMYKELDISIIHDMIDAAPDLPDDVGSKAKEVVALKCLENIFIARDSSRNGNPSTEAAKVQFDPSESCLDVLQKILYETSEYDLRMASPEMWKWDVGPYIAQKKASMPKCTLLQLKDLILDGTISIADYLKRRSGLVAPNRSNSRPGSLSDKGTRGKDNSTLVHNNRRRLSKKDPISGRSLIPPRRVRTSLTSVHLEDTDGIIIDGNKSKQGPVIQFHSGKQKMPLHGKTQLPSASETLVPDATRNSNDDLAKNHMGSLPEERIDCPFNVGESRQNTSISEVDWHRFEKEISREYNESSEFVMKRNKAMSSQNTFANDSTKQDDSFEDNLCMKCHRGGMLLACRTTNCPLLVHKKCFDSAAIGFDGKGDFYCPFCSYSHIIVQYHEAKKKVSMAKKDLCAFLQGGL